MQEKQSAWGSNKVAEQEGEAPGMESPLSEGVQDDDGGGEGGGNGSVRAGTAAELLPSNRARQPPSAAARTAAPPPQPVYGGRLQVTMMEGNEQRACTLLTPRQPCDDEVILLCL